MLQRNDDFDRPEEEENDLRPSPELIAQITEGVKQSDVLGEDDEVPDDFQHKMRLGFYHKNELDDSKEEIVPEMKKKKPLKRGMTVAFKEVERVDEKLSEEEMPQDDICEPCLSDDKQIKKSVNFVGF